MPQTPPGVVILFHWPLLELNNRLFQTYYNKQHDQLLSCVCTAAQKPTQKKKKKNYNNNNNKEKWFQSIEYKSIKMSFKFSQPYRQKTNKIDKVW